MKKEELFNIENDEFRKDFFKDLAYFLKSYNNEVINKVIKKIGFIIENEHIRHLLHELRIRGEKEYNEFSNNLFWRVGEYLDDSNYDMSYDLQSHPLEHASSYRDVLYDLLIK